MRDTVEDDLEFSLELNFSLFLEYVRMQESYALLFNKQETYNHNQHAQKSCRNQATTIRTERRSWNEQVAKENASATGDHHCSINQSEEWSRTLTGSPWPTKNSLAKGLGVLALKRASQARRCKQMSRGHVQIDIYLACTINNNTPSLWYRY